ncbi:MAG: HEAT repeat domain-containing protein [Haloglomus sp.]
MSNGDDGEPDAAEESPDGEAGESEDALEATADLESRLDEAETALEDAETEADLDDVAATLDDVAGALPEEPEEGEEDEATAEARSRLEDLRAEVESRRGPYAEDVVAALEDAAATLRDSEWTEDGELAVIPAVETFLDAAGEQLLDTFEADSDDPAALADAVESASEAIAETDLDPDEDAETLETLQEAATTLTDDLEAAEVWSDLSVREQLDAEGFYDVLDPENRKDFPAEWNAVKLHEKAYADGEDAAVEHILTALERFESDFMEENVLDSLRRIAPPEAVEDLLDLAENRNKDAIEILGKIGDERATDTLHEFVAGGDVALRTVTLRALGAIGSADSTQVVADQLADDNPEVRSTAARALGLLGDTRAIDPLADVLAEDDADEVRASAAWALNQIGTERAREAAAAYADDRSYIVQTEAEKARDATERAA